VKENEEEREKLVEDYKNNHEQYKAAKEKMKEFEAQLNQI